MTTEPTDAELKAMWQLHAADIGGIFCYARAVLAKWGQPAQPDPAYSEACYLATALFKKHFAHLPDFASGQAVWSLCDSTAGVILQVDNMVSCLVQPPTTSPQTAQPAPQPVEREPLSHAQAKALVLKYGNDPLNLVFQVELAHGIKGGQHVS